MRVAAFRCVVAIPCTIALAARAVVASRINACYTGCTAKRRPCHEEGSMATVRWFISHSHSDNAWCREFVAVLQAAGWDVWYDEAGISAGDEWVAAIQRELQSREIFLLILTPSAWASPWVQREL